MSASSKQQEVSTQREIAVFWDYENVPLPSWCKAADASKAIVTAVSKYGRIVDRRLYFDFGKQGGNLMWTGLDASGFDLVNTPRRNQKETLDKKLIADVLTFAWDSAVRNDNCKPCVVLLTSDGDYAYTLSKLRDRGVMSVVMYGKDCSVANVLTTSADIPLSFEDDVLKKNLPEEAVNSTSVNVAPVVDNSNAPDSDAIILCKAISKLDSEDGWVLGSTIGLCFKNTTNVDGEEGKERFRKARDEAVANGWMKRGRRRLSGAEKNRIVVSPSSYTGSGVSGSLSQEDYMRLTPKGETMASGKDAAETPVTHLFLKNISRSATVQDLVSFLESACNISVQRVVVEPGPLKTPFYFAHVQIETPEQTSQLLRHANASKLTLNGRVISASYDKNVPKGSYSRNQAFFYERKKSDLVASKDSDIPPDVLALCKTIFSTVSPKEWIDGGITALKFRNSIKLPATSDNQLGKERFKRARAKAVSLGLLEVGRRKLDGSSGEIVAVSKDVGAGSQLSKELYLRLTQKGADLMESLHPSSEGNNHQATANLFLRNLPVSTSIHELVHYFEDTHKFPIRRASIQASHPKASMCFAHLEFFNKQDAAKILQLTRAKNPGQPALMFGGRPILAAPDENIPKIHSSSSGQVYESAGTRPVTSPESDAAKPAPSPIDEPSPRASSQHDAATFCSVLFQMRTGHSKGSSGDWLQSGMVGGKFQRTISVPNAALSKERYKNARDNAISQGLVEMGRRKLNTDNEEKEIVVVPRFSGMAAPNNLSSESYLRLTKKGIILAKESVSTNEVDKAQEMVATSEVNSTGLNLYLRNLPRTANIQDVVHWIENTHKVRIYRACIASAHPKAKFSTAHIEFQCKEDALDILSMTRDMGGNGLVYAGRAIYAGPDQKIPNWTECDPNSFYESDISGVSIESRETNNALATVATKTHTKQEDTLETTDLLFGDNLALLYAQSQSPGGLSPPGRSALDGTNDETSDCDALLTGTLHTASPARNSEVNSSSKISDFLW